MAKNAPPPSPGPAPKKKPVVRRSDWIIITIILLIFVYILLNNFGVNVVEKSEKMEMTDDPHPQR